MDSVALTAQDSAQVPENVRPDAGIGEQYKEYKPLYERFGAREGSPSTDKALAQIWEYAKENAGNKDRDSVMWEVTKLLNRFGSPSSGDKPWSKALVWVQTHRRMLEAEKMMREMEAHRG